MRRVVVSLAGLTIVLCGGVMRSAAIAADGVGAETTASIDEMAEKIFKEADRNHNGVLNRGEFSTAEDLLQNSLDQLGRSGAIGKQKKTSKKDQDRAESASKSTKTSLEKLEKAKSVSQAQFTYLVHSAIEEADEQWREYNAMTDAQRKAMAAQRSMMSRRGRRMMVPNYYPAPY